MAISTETLGQIDQLKQQQALITSALAAMVNGAFEGEPPSVTSLLLALDPTLAEELHPRTPVYGQAGGTRQWWDPGTPPVRQTKPWDCSCATTAWILQSMGVDVSQDDVITALGPSQVNPAVGLTDGSGAALAALITRLAGHACRTATLSYDEVYSLAGIYPLGISPRGMYHWMACSGTDDTGGLKLANPAPGYMRVFDQIDRGTFNQLGPVRVVWCLGPAS